MIRRHWPGAGLLLVLVLALVALGAPLLANDRPLILRTSGGVSLPAAGDLPWIGRAVEQTAWTRRDWSRTVPGEVWRLPAPIAYSYRQVDLQHALAAPSADHLLGTDSLGRDLAARLLHGATTSVEVGVISTLVAFVIGVLAGSLAGAAGKGVDFILSRSIEVVMCFPTFFLILTVLAFWPPSMPLLFVVIGLTRWPEFARYVRGEVLRVREAAFVDAARVSGAGGLRTIVLHVLPHALHPALVVATFSVAGGMLIEAGLSFLGFGAPEPLPSWGSLLRDAQGTGHWWLILFPGLALALAVTSVQLAGERLRDRLDPRRRTPA
ncbi:MAG: ABC transporter permease [Acidobacteriota bacterium]